MSIDFERMIDEGATADDLIEASRIARDAVDFEIVEAGDTLYKLTPTPPGSSGDETYRSQSHVEYERAPLLDLGRPPNDEERALWAKLDAEITIEQAREHAIADMRETLKPTATDLRNARAARRSLVDDPAERCTRCGGTGEYLHFGVCYGFGGSGRRDSE